MKKTMVVILSALAAGAVFAVMPRSEWHAKVGECALDPIALKATISQLSSSDKTAFLAEVNEAISKMPGSAEVKAAQFLVANRAAVTGAGSADRAAVLAEVFATVPVESLTVVLEEFAKNEFARSGSMDDRRFVNIVKSAMGRIVERCSSAESGAARAALAGMMFVRAAGSAEQSATEQVIASLPQDVRKEARESWYPAARGKDQPKSYDAILASSQAGEEPDHAEVVSMYSQQMVDTMLADLQFSAGPGDKAGGSILNDVNADFNHGDVDALGVRFVQPPRSLVNVPFIPESVITGNPEDSDKVVENPAYSGGSGYREPGPYWLQSL